MPIYVMYAKFSLGQHDVGGVMGAKNSQRVLLTYHHIEKLMPYLMHVIILHTELFPIC